MLLDITLKAGLIIGLSDERQESTTSPTDKSPYCNRGEFTLEYVVYVSMSIAKKRGTKPQLNQSSSQLIEYNNRTCNVEAGPMVQSPIYTVRLRIS